MRRAEAEAEPQRKEDTMISNIISAAEARFVLIPLYSEEIDKGETFETFCGFQVGNEDGIDIRIVGNYTNGADMWELHDLNSSRASSRWAYREHHAVCPDALRGSAAGKAI